MLENTQIRSAEASAEIERKRPMPIGRRFQKGQCANPGGRPGKGKQFHEQYDRLQAQLEAEGGKLTPVEQALLAKPSGCCCAASAPKIIAKR